jgi:uncharacterized protein YbcI
MSAPPSVGSNFGDDWFVRPTWPQHRPTTPSTGVRSTAISNAVVHAFAEHLGRGPTRARTSIRDDVVLCVLEDNLTKAERSLVAGGRDEIVLEARRAHQSTMRGELMAEVERLTGRKVIAFMSDNHIDPDIATETFVLEPIELELVT